MKLGDDLDKGAEMLGRLVLVGIALLVVGVMSYFILY